MSEHDRSQKRVFGSSETISFAGLGFYWAWLFLVFYSPVLLPDSETPGLAVQDIWMWSAWAHAITLLLSALLARRIGSLLEHKPIVLATSVIACAGTAMISLGYGSIGSLPNVVVLSLIGAVLSGVGTAWIVLMWGEIYSRIGARSSFFGIIASYVVSAALYFLVPVLSSQIAIVSVILLPAFSTLLVWFGGQREATGRDVHTRLAPKRFAPRTLLPLAAIFLYALCGEVLRGFATTSGERQSLDLMGMLYVAGGALGLVVLGALVAFIPAWRKANLGDLPGIRTALLVMAAGFLVTALFNVSFFVAYAIFGAAFMICRALVWTYSAYITERLDVSALAVFGTSQGCFALAVVVGTPVVQGLTSTVLVGQTQWTMVALVAVFLIFASAVFIVNEKDLKTIWGMAAFPKGGEEVGKGDRSSTMGIDPLLAVKKNYGLSDREYEVALLLAKGRSLPFIQRELHIAKGTAQTHLSHIYRKLDVHNRQEFIDLVESKKADEEME